jgi:hypothetical protein
MSRFNTPCDFNGGLLTDLILLTRSSHANAPFYQ